MNLNAYKFAIICCISILLWSCEEDPLPPENESPVIEIDQPEAEEVFYLGNAIPIKIKAEDNIELHYVQVHLHSTEATDSSRLSLIEASYLDLGKEFELDSSIQAPLHDWTQFVLTVSAKDHDGNEQNDSVRFYIYPIEIDSSDQVYPTIILNEPASILYLSGATMYIDAIAFMDTIDMSLLKASIINKQDNSVYYADSVNLLADTLRFNENVQMPVVTVSTDYDLKIEAVDAVERSNTRIHSFTVRP